ncbi:DUF5337 domain-containing protein [Pseudooceanicola nanhaiensis]|jgi:hypothetical protein|uniref:DUF5337 domain-containing protein n=1 Tax=Pseudooceanicola nanhaiensis TaxID=375761 RepID=A0A917WAI3_9RHOB|nr:DUF5337 domain-containing protein [Pseudooceanicola nanhaiensis]GGL87550.1 hypothetical protein GCM10011534_06940 [Pseudooceanicola nanhaiensis]
MNREDRQQTERAMARKGRTVALVIAATMVIWLVGTTLVPYMGWPARFVFLFDMAAIAAFIWVFVVIWQIWQLRQQLNENGPR